MGSTRKCLTGRAKQVPGEVTGQNWGELKDGWTDCFSSEVYNNDTANAKTCKCEAVKIFKTLEDCCGDDNDKCVQALDFPREKLDSGDCDDSSDGLSGVGFQAKSATVIGVAFVSGMVTTMAFGYV